MKKTMKRRKKRGGLGATPPRSTRKKGFSMENLKNEMSPVLMISAGVIAGTFASKMLDKVVKPEAQIGIKAAIKPVVLIVGGAALKLMSDNKMLKDVGTGIAISGMLAAVKKIDKKGAILGELSGVDDDEPIQIGVPSYNPELPELPQTAFAGEDDEDESFDGSEDLSGDDDYQNSIGEIEDAVVEDFI